MGVLLNTPSCSGEQHKNRSLPRLSALPRSSDIDSLACYKRTDRIQSTLSSLRKFTMFGSFVKVLCSLLALSLVEPTLSAPTPDAQL